MFCKIIKYHVILANTMARVMGERVYIFRKTCRAEVTEKSSTLEAYVNTELAGFYHKRQGLSHSMLGNCAGRGV
jgi:hypothetical protein